MNELKELVLSYLNHSKRNLHLNDLNNSLNIDKETKRKYLLDALNELEMEGKIYRPENNHYSIAPKNYHIVELLPTVGRSKKFYIDNKKYFIGARKLNGALDFDHVGVIINRDDSVTVVRTISRNTGHVVCEMVANKNGELIPKRIDDKLPIKLNPKESKSLVEGDLIKVKLPLDSTDGVFEAELVEVIGHRNDPDIEIRAIAASKDIPLEFSKEYIEKLKDIPSELREEDYKDRTDLRDERIFTIDCDSTKDIDDACGIKKLENGNYELTVCIADLPHYIKSDSIFFKEACKRNTSYYLSNYVIPMFHSKISNGICSLNPNVDRLATTIRMEITPECEVVNYDIFKSVINSKKKMKYSDVNKIVEENKMVEGYEPFKEDLLLMKELSDIIENNKINNGYLHFISNELDIKYDEDGNPIKFDKAISRSAEKLIENFMIIANITYIEHCYWMDIPCVYRNHVEPDEEKLQNTVELLCEMGYSHLFKQNFKGSQKEIQILLDKINKLEEGNILSNLVLRSMKRAKYNPENAGHYALGLKTYGQFTSPIRRLGDYLNHTFLNHYYFNKKIKNINELEENLEEYCENINHSEIIAESAEKMSVELEMSKYMQKHLNKQFTARIISMDKKGIKIETKDNITGYIDLDEFYRTNKLETNYFGRIGDEILVTAYWIDRLRNRIFFNFNKNLTLEKSGHHKGKHKTRVKHK